MTNRSLVRAIVLGSVVIAAGACHRAGAARPVIAGLPVGMTLQTIALGDSLFHARSCVRCHGADAKGAQNGPDLTTTTHLHVNGTYDDFVRLITSGVPKDSIKVSSHRFAMQPRGGTQSPLTDEQVRAVAAFVYSLSHKPGT